MNRSDPDHVMDLLAEAVELSGSQQRDFLDSCCAGQPELRRELDALLACAHPAAKMFDTVVQQAIRADPKEIGPYELLEQVGEGGMAVVYKAQQHHPIKRLVAVKLIKLGMDTRQFVARFESERQALAMMDHPNIAQVYDAGSTQTGRPYFVMEYVAGKPILRWCDEHRLSLPDRLKLFMNVCDAVEHAHRKGIIHRDLKSSNVLVSDLDGRAVPKVIDFGVSKVVAPADGRSTETEHCQIIGTPEYMSPEQAGRGTVDIDTRADVYSLGVLLYELIAGVKPISDDVLRSGSYEQIRQAICQAEPDTPSTRLSRLQEGDAAAVAQARGMRSTALVRMLHNELEWIPLKAMRKDRERRYRSASELADDIRNYIARRPLIAGPETRVYRARKFVRRHRAGVATALLVALVIIGGIVAVTIQTVRARRAEAQARLAEARAISERDSAQATLSFLANDVLSSATPENISDARIRDEIVRAMIEPAARRVGDSFKDRPLVEASVRQAIQTVLREIGRAELAMPHAQAALNIRRRELGDDHPDTIQAITDYAKVLRELGRFAEAEPLYKESFDRRQRLQGKDHPDTLSAQNNYALILEKLNRFSESEPLLKDNLERRRAVLGEDHSLTIISLGNYASSLLLQGKIAESEPLQREALERRRHTAGDDHPLTLTAINNYADLLTRLGKMTEAEPLWKELLERYRRVMGPDHPSTLSVASNYAVFLRRAGREAQALTLHKQILEDRTRVLGSEHPDTVVTLSQYARGLVDAGKLAEAEAPARQAMELHRRRLGEDHLVTIRSTGIYGGVLLKLGRAEEAEKIFEELAERSERLVGPDSQDTLHKMDTRVAALLQLNRAAEGEAVARETVARAAGSRSLGPQHVETRRYAARHAQCLDALGRREEADGIREKYGLNASTTRPATKPS